ncbi:ArfGap-domain-containing protein [Gloeophyllum trabeum ATCC 11539]|uniref:ArfGap-domain-containing protein n=1 Tax=Gloeophyllum trabeum (strain ATCC 11539 / FP-39264 / Madison 617) TaxID=670483 RepID=S7S172_GLOTA|nr:ArfGap-domain-containing protein [Gloeophyllum trabeum ATCC 11539]EPQ61165.1 ArfGap-domain-containing protein [Gloeophyllum trabeum ATCC 11539]
MSRQDKATTERHARTLRELLKRPENKVCADCKRNDPRWASWNIGVFLCIRCSGIHRSMGTHISRVKSVDLDIWTPEQMASVQKWGNRRANAYWEAHLKAGHVPPDHKIESFIRSKYETRRWAMDGPLPADPSVLDNGAEVAPAAPASPPPAMSAPSHSSRPSVVQGVSTRQPAPPVTTRQPQPHQLLSTTVQQSKAAAAQVQAPSHQQTPAPAPAPAPENDLFSLDFHSPPTPSNNSMSPTSTSAPKKDVKQDILSLFSAPSPVAATPVAQPGFGTFGVAPAAASPWGQPQAQPTHAHTQSQSSVSMMGTNGAGMWGASSGWSAPVPPAQGNLWSNPASQPAPAAQQDSLFAMNDVWSSSAATTAPAAASNDLFGSPFSTTAPAQTQKKDDVFGDLWGDFK